MKTTLNAVSAFLIILSVIVPFGLPPAMHYWHGIWKTQNGPDSNTATREIGSKPFVVDISELPVLGRKSAKVAIIEFSDFECPFCSHHANSVRPEIQLRFIDSGNLQYAFSNNPLDMHPRARALASAAFCADNQGQFWHMYQEIFRMQPSDTEGIMELARVVVPDLQRFDRCLKSDAPSRRIEADLELAKKLELNGTPAFGLGRIDGRSRVNVEKIILGSQSIDVFSATITQLLETTSKS